MQKEVKEVQVVADKVSRRVRAEAREKVRDKAKEERAKDMVSRGMERVKVSQSTK